MIEKYLDRTIINKMDGSFKAYQIYNTRLEEIKSLENQTYKNFMI